LVSRNPLARSLLLAGQPDKASEPGRIGGGVHAAGETPDPLPTLDNAIAVRETVAPLIADVYAGRIHPRIVAGSVALMNLQLQAIGTTCLELLVAKLEKLSAELEKLSAEVDERLDRGKKGQRSELDTPAFRRY
jgi:hypothetical protein